MIAWSPDLIAEECGRSTAGLHAELARAVATAHTACTQIAAAIDRIDRLGLAPEGAGARSIRAYLRARRARASVFGDLFEDPAWDMLLDLYAAGLEGGLEGGRVSVTSLCLAAGCPPTTAMRWIGRLAASGLVERIPDGSDRRRAFVELTDVGRRAMAGYLHRYAASWTGDGASYAVSRMTTHPSAGERP